MVSDVKWGSGASSGVLLILTLDTLLIKFPNTSVLITRSFCSFSK